MIQRIQSIYLLLAAIFPLFTLFVPLISTPTTQEAQWPTWSYHTLTMLTTATALISLFRYKNRKAQTQWANTAIISNLAWYATFTIINYHNQAQDTLLHHTHIGLLFPILSIATLYLAKKAIKHDEQLVRAADRIR